MVTAFQSVAEYDPELRISNNSSCSFFTYYILLVFDFHMFLTEYTLLVIKSIIIETD